MIRCGYWTNDHKGASDISPTAGITAGGLQISKQGYPPANLDAQCSTQSKAEHWRLSDGVAARASEFAPDRANDFERCCDPGELLGHILADRLHMVAAVRATRFGLERMMFAREVRR